MSGWSQLIDSKRLYHCIWKASAQRSCTQYLVIFCTQIKCRYLQWPFVIWYTYCTTYRDKNNLPPSSPPTPLISSHQKKQSFNNNVLACHPKQTLWAFCHCMAMKTLGNNNKSWVHKKNPAHPTQMTKFYSYKQTPASCFPFPLSLWSWCYLFVMT